MRWTLKVKAWSSTPPGLTEVMTEDTATEAVENSRVEETACEMLEEFSKKTRCCRILQGREQC